MSRVFRHVSGYSLRAAGGATLQERSGTNRHSFVTSSCSPGASREGRNTLPRSDPKTLNRLPCILARTVPRSYCLLLITCLEQKQTACQCERVRVPSGCATTFRYLEIACFPKWQRWEFRCSQRVPRNRHSARHEQQHQNPTRIARTLRQRIMRSV